MLVVASMSWHRARRLLVQSVFALIPLVTIKLSGSVQDAIRFYRGDLSSFQLSFIPDMAKGAFVRVAFIELGPGAVTAEVDRTQPVGWTPRHDELELAEQPRVVIRPPQVKLDRAGLALLGSRQRSDRVALRSTSVSGWSIPSLLQRWTCLLQFIDATLTMSVGVFSGADHEPITGALGAINVNRLAMEFASKQSQGTDVLARFLADKVLGLVVIDNCDLKIEDRETIIARVESVLEHAPLRRSH